MVSFYNIVSPDGLTMPIIPLTDERKLKETGRIYKIQPINGRNLTGSKSPGGIIKDAINSRFSNYIKRIEDNSAEGPVTKKWWQENFNYYYEYRDEDAVKAEGSVDYRPYLSKLFLEQICKNPTFLMNEKQFRFDNAKDNDAQAQAVIDSAFYLFELCVDNQNDPNVNYDFLPALLNIHYEFQKICGNNNKINPATKEYFDAAFLKLCKKIGFADAKSMLEDNDTMVKNALKAMKDVLHHSDYYNDGVNKEHHEGYKALVEAYDSLPDNTPLERFIKLQAMQKVVAAREPGNIFRNMARNDTGEQILKTLGFGRKPEKYIPGLSNQVLTVCQSALFDYERALANAYVLANPQVSNQDGPKPLNPK